MVHIWEDISQLAPKAPPKARPAFGCQLLLGSQPPAGEVPASHVGPWAHRAEQAGRQQQPSGVRTGLRRLVWDWARFSRLTRCGAELRRSVSPAESCWVRGALGGFPWSPGPLAAFPTLAFLAAVRVLRCRGGRHPPGQRRLWTCWPSLCLAPPLATPPARTHSGPLLGRRGAGAGAWEGGWWRLAPRRARLCLSTARLPGLSPRRLSVSPCSVFLVALLAFP